MLLTEKVKIGTSNSNYKYYRNLGYEFNIFDKIIVDINDLNKNSLVPIIVKCDVCGEEKMTIYRTYLNSMKNGGFYTCCKCKSIKFKKTCMNKYGVENVSQIDSVKEKKIETNLKNWGTENVFQSEEIKEVSRKTKKEKYNNENFTNREKCMKTCFEHNGVDWPTKSEKVLSKRNENNVEKFGKEHYQQTEEYKERVNKSNLEKYGNKWYMGTEDFREKSKNTMLEKYGVEYGSQDYKIHRKQINISLKLHNIGICYQGTYEKDFLDLCEELNLEVERGNCINYVFEDINKVYHPDFYIEKYNLIVEVKSSYWLKVHEKINEEKRLATIERGYEYLYIIDKNYEEFLNLIKL